MNDKKDLLAGVRVLDLTRLRSGPTAVRQLGDWGADVIKIESPEALGVSDGWGDARLGADFQNLHRNKRSITLNLKDHRGIEIFKKLVVDADVVVENFRPNVKHKLGIDYESLKKINPKLIYASVSAYGQDGPYSTRPGYDQIVQGMGGLMSVTGLPGQGPVRAGFSVADSATGLYCALGIMVALFNRERTGEGAWIHTSLLESIIALSDYQAARWLVSKEIPEQAGNDHPTSIPTGVFSTADGYINIAGAGAQQMWERLCKAIDAEYLLSREEYKTGPLRSKNRKALSQDLNDVLRKKTSAEWIEILSNGNVACGPIYRMDEVFSDVQTKHLKIAHPVSHPVLGEIELVGQPITFSNSTFQIKNATPNRGEHNYDVLMQYGYTKEELDHFAEQMVI